MTLIPNEPSRYVSGVESNHRGVPITAAREAVNQWRPTVDGDFYGERRYLSSRDALRAARRVVDRRLGVGRTPPMTATDDPEWATALRASIR